MMVSFPVSLGLLSAFFFVASAEEMWQAVPGCAKAFLWSKQDRYYWKDTLKQIYDKEASDHKRQLEKVIHQVSMDEDAFGGADFFRDCISHPSSSNVKFFKAIADCRDKTLTASMREYVLNSIIHNPDDGKKALETTKSDLSLIFKSGSKSKRVENFVKCTEDKTK